MTVNYSKKELLFQQVSANRIAIYGLRNWQVFGFQLKDRFVLLGHFIYCNYRVKWQFTQKYKIVGSLLNEDMLLQIGNNLRELNEKTTE